MTIIGYMGFLGKPKNKRGNDRKELNAQAWISLNGGFAVRPCTVLDISNTGVRLAVTGPPQTIPNTFTLRMSRNNSDMGRAVRVKWRRGSEIGVMFV